MDSLRCKNFSVIYSFSKTTCFLCYEHSLKMFQFDFTEKYLHFWDKWTKLFKNLNVLQRILLATGIEEYVCKDVYFKSLLLQIRRKKGGVLQLHRCRCIEFCFSNNKTSSIFFCLRIYRQIVIWSFVRRISSERSLKSASTSLSVLIQILFCRRWNNLGRILQLQLPIKSIEIESTTLSIALQIKHFYWLLINHKRCTFCML